MASNSLIIKRIVRGYHVCTRPSGIQISMTNWTSIDQYNQESMIKTLKGRSVKCPRFNKKFCQRCLASGYTILNFTDMATWVISHVTSAELQHGHDKFATPRRSPRLAAVNNPRFSKSSFSASAASSASTTGLVTWMKHTDQMICSLPWAVAKIKNSTVNVEIFDARKFRPFLN